MYKIYKNCIKIGGLEVVFPPETTIQKVELLENLLCFNTWPLEEDLNWNDMETHNIWKKRCEENPSELFCYELSGKLKWKFPEENIVGFDKIDLDKLTESSFITPKHYR